MGGVNSIRYSNKDQYKVNNGKAAGAAKTGAATGAATAAPIQGKSSASANEDIVKLSAVAGQAGQSTGKVVTIPNNMDSLPNVAHVDAMKAAISKIMADPSKLNNDICVCLAEKLFSKMISNPEQK